MGVVVEDTETGARSEILKAPVTEKSWEATSNCWSSGCDCDQVKAPRLRTFFYTIAFLALIGLMWDTFRFMKFGPEAEEGESDPECPTSGDKKKSKKDKKEKKEKKREERRQRRWRLREHR